MISFSLAIGLSLLFGVILLGIGAEIYYLLWWKKRITKGEMKDDYISSSWELFDMFSWKKPSSLSSSTLISQSNQEQDTQLHASKDMVLKPFGEDDIESELKRLHNLGGPTRFLCTIKEETKEDLESEDGRSRDGRSRKGSRGRSLSDLLFKVDSPLMTPLPSPPCFSPPVTPRSNYNSNHGLNPLYESSTDGEVNRIRSSPPPKFKFLKDAEEKLYRRILIEEAAKRLQKNGGVGQDDKIKVSPTSTMVKDEKDGSTITIRVDKINDKDRRQHKHLDQQHSNASQVLPLASSPSPITPSNVPLQPQRFT